MIPDKAKELAHQGGWNRPKKGSIANMLFEVTALDPSFYRALKIPKEQALYFLEQVLNNDEEAISQFWRKWIA